MGTDSQRVLVLVLVHPRMLYGPWVPTLVCPATEAHSGSEFKKAV